MKKKITLIALIIAILLLDIVFVYRGLNYSYTMQGDTKELFAPYYSYTLDCDYNPSTGEFVRSGEDPQFYLYGLSETLGGLEIKLASALDEPMRVEVFYQTATMSNFSARKSVVTTLPAGETTCFIKLPLGVYQALRFDLDGTYTLQSITGCDKAMKKTPIFNGSTLLTFLKWLPLCIIGILLFYLAHKDRYERTGSVVRSLFVQPDHETRNHGYDLLRIIAALMVICMHAARTALSGIAKELAGYHFVYILFIIGLSCNMLYIMLSGALLLQDKQESVLEFYRKRFGKVVIPLLCYYVLFLDFNHIFDDSLGAGILTSIKMILSGAPSFAPQFWLVYTLIALYLFTPFLRKMVKILNTQMLQTLVMVIIILNLLTSYLPLVGINFGVTSSLASFLGAYLVGYYMTTDAAARHNGMYIRIGIFSLFLSILLAYARPENIAYISNCVPTTLFISCGLFALVRMLQSFFNRPHYLLEFFSKYSYSIILVHWYILFVVVETYLGINPQRGRIFGGAVATIVLTFLLSAAYGFFFENIIILPIQYAWNKLLTLFKKRSVQTASTLLICLSIGLLTPSIKAQAYALETPTGAIILTGTDSAIDKTGLTELEVVEDRNITLMAVGDDLMHMGVVRTGQMADGTFDYSFLFRGIEDFLAAADIKVINQETPFAGNERGFSGYPRFNSPTQVGDAIAAAGFNVALQASNHSADQGKDGMISCAKEWAKHPEILMVGLHSEVPQERQIPLLTIDGVTIAILNYTYSTNSEVFPSSYDGYVDILCALDEKSRRLDFTRLNPKVIEDIQAADALADFVIVFPHWGTEYQTSPSTYQKNFAKEMTQAGADLIIGTHPHVIQPVEWVQADNGNVSLCYYSLGNYVSTQKGALSMLEALAWVTLHVDDTGVSIVPEATGAIPMVCQYLSGPVRIDNIYLLENYTAELAASHGIRDYGGVILRLEDLQNWSSQILGDFVISADTALSAKPSSHYEAVSTSTAQ